MTTPAQKTIALLRDLVKGTTYRADKHIAEVKQIEKQHANDIIKQKMLCDFIIEDFTRMVHHTCTRKWALYSAREASSAHHMGNKVLSTSILSLITIPK